MDRKRILYAFSTDPVVSPFDVNVAYDAGFDVVYPLAGATPESATGLVQDIIFSRGVSGTKATAIFVGGADLDRVEAIGVAAAKAMFKPFQVPVFLDPKGAYTTAGALVAKVEQGLARRGAGGLEGKAVAVLGGTGPVGRVAGALAASAGARVTLVETLAGAEARRAAERATASAKARYGVDLAVAQAASPGEAAAALRDAEVVLATAKAGVQVLPRAVLDALPAVRLAADVNAVPPAGVEGLDARADLLDLTPRAAGIGALAVGDLKMKVELDLMRRLLDETDRGRVLDHRAALEAARALLAGK
jgi:methylene-tetrahydromethanopterin dehydrogenase